MFSELLQHLQFCTSSTKLFRGRLDILEKLKIYIKNVDRNQPMALDGPSGCGKSSILAKTALEVNIHYIIYIFLTQLDLGLFDQFIVLKHA